MVLTSYVQAFDDILMFKNSTDGALIFENEKGNFFFYSHNLRETYDDGLC